MNAYRVIHNQGLKCGFHPYNKTINVDKSNDLSKEL